MSNDRVRSDKFDTGEADAAGIEIGIRQPDGTFETIPADQAGPALKRREAKTVKRHLHSVPTAATKVAKAVRRKIGQ